MSHQLLLGDCVERMRELPENSVDSVVCDPPFFLHFMGRKWDHAPTPKEQQQQHEAWAREAIRVLKPGAFALVAGGTRTFHRLVCALEDAGFEIRDTISHIHGQGFPKSKSMRDIGRPELGTSLKPAFEPWTLARKSLSESSVARNILAHGTGGINVDASRVQNSGPHGTEGRKKFNGFNPSDGIKEAQTYKVPPNPTGRFPSNLLLSHCPPDENGKGGCRRVGVKRIANPGGKPNKDEGASKTSNVYRWAASGGRYKKSTYYADSEGFEQVEEWECVRDEDGNYLCPIALLDEQSKGTRADKPSATGTAFRGGMFGIDNDKPIKHKDNGGGASRFFQQFEPDTGAGFLYQAKASRAERNRGLPEGMTNNHPTVKSQGIMRYLVRMITPPGGTCLDPFAGSGSTGVACIYEGFDFIGIEQDEEYIEIAARRIEHWSRPQPEPAKPVPVKVVEVEEWSGTLFDEEAPG